MDGIHSRSPDNTPKTPEEAISTALLTTSRVLLGPPVWISKTRVTNEWAADCCPGNFFCVLVRAWMWKQARQVRHNSGITSLLADFQGERFFSASTSSMNCAGRVDMMYGWALQLECMHGGHVCRYSAQPFMAVAK